MGLNGVPDRPFLVTFFEDKSAQSQRPEMLSLRSLASLTARTTATAKDRLSLLKLARFGDLRTVENNCLRHNANVVGVTGVEVDYDGENVSFDIAVGLLQRSEIYALVYTSPSHTDDAPRWRVLCPISIELSPEQRSRQVDRLNGVLGGIVALESWTLSQSFYFGSVRDNPAHRVEVVEGQYIDLVPGLDEGAIGKPGKPGRSGSTTSANERPVRSASYVPASEKRHERYRQSVLATLRREATDGQKHAALLRSAKALGHVAAAAGFADDDLVQDLMDALPSSVADWKQAERTARDGLAYGRDDPRPLEDRPEWASSNDDQPHRGSNGSTPPPEAPEPPDGDWWNAPPEGAAEIEWLPPGYSRDDNGMWFQEKPKKRAKKAVEGEEEAPSSRIWICAPFQVLAEIADENSGDWGLLVGWTDRSKVRHEIPVKRRLLHATRNEIAALLDDNGLTCGVSDESHRHLKVLLSRMWSRYRRTCVSFGGWHKTAAGYNYVFADGETFGPDAGAFVLDRSDPGATRQSGTLQEWQDNVGAIAPGNHLMGIAIMAGLAPVLMEVSGDTSGGVHVFGPAQCGKSTLTNTTASAWGPPATDGFIKTWHMTLSGLEVAASQRNDGLLPMDELGEGEAKAVGQAVYMIANQTGKVRANPTMTAQRVRTWRVGLFSTGEVDLATKLSERDITVTAGQEVRLINIPVARLGRFGVWQDLKGRASGADLSIDVKIACTKYHGTSARAFIERVAQTRQENPDWLARAIEKKRDEFIRQFLPPGADGQVVSVARRFGLVAAAGALATYWKILPWPDGEAMKAAASGFKAWLSYRGGSSQSSEEMLAVRAVRRFIEFHGESRFTPIGEPVKKAAESQASYQQQDTVRAGEPDPAADAPKTDRPTFNRVGYRKALTEESVEYWILEESWREVCKPSDPGIASKALIKSGHLRKDGKHHRCYRTLPGVGRARVYVISSSIMRGEDADEAAPEACPPGSMAAAELRRQAFEHFKSNEIADQWMVSLQPYLMGQPQDICQKEGGGKKCLTCLKSMRPVDAKSWSMTK